MVDLGPRNAPSGGPGDQTSRHSATGTLAHSRLSSLSDLLARARAIALDGLRMRRVGPHVDALLPRALERILHGQPHPPDAVDLEVHGLAVLQGTQTLVVGAAGDEIPGVERHDRRRELDQLGNRVLHVVGVVVVTELAVHPELDVDVVGLRYLVGGGDARPDGRERVEGFSEPAPGLPRPTALAARGDVDHARVAEDGAPPPIAMHHLGRSLDDERQLRLVHEDPGLGVRGQHDRVARADHRVRVLEEHVERPGIERAVLPVVGDARQDLARPRQRRAQADLRQRPRRPLRGQTLEPRPQTVEAVDDPLHRELRRVTAGHDGRSVDHTLGGQHTGADIAVGGVEEHQLHARRPQRRSVARRAPSARAANLSHATLGCVSLNRTAEAANPQSAPAMTFSRPTRAANRMIRSAISSGCSTRLVVWLMTPGIRILPSAGLNFSNTWYSCSWRGFAASNEYAPASIRSRMSTMSFSSMSWTRGPTSML